MINPEAIPSPKVRKPTEEDITDVLDQIEHAPITVHIDELQSNGQQNVRLALPYSYTLEGLWVNEGEYHEAYLNYLRVNPLLQARHIGLRLVRAFAGLSKDEGATLLSGSPVSRDIMRAMKGAFSDLDISPINPREPIDLTTLDIDHWERPGRIVYGSSS